MEKAGINPTQGQMESISWPDLADPWEERSARGRRFQAQAVMEAAGVHTVRRSRDPGCPGLMHLLAPGGEVEATDLGDGWVIIRSVDLGTEDPLAAQHRMEGEHREEFLRRRQEAHDGFWRRLREITSARPELGPRPTLDRGEDTRVEELPWPGGQETLGAERQMEEFIQALGPLGLSPRPLRATTDPVAYRLWRADLPHGSVRFWDGGNGWTTIGEVDLPPEEARAFARNLQQAAEERRREEQAE